VSAVVFSTTAIFIRHLTGTYALAAGVLSFWRSVLLVASLAAVLAVARPRLLRARRADLVFLGALGLVLAVFNLLWTTSVARCGAAIATVLVYTSGAFTALLGLVLLRERLGRWGLAAMGLCMAGCTLVSGALEGGGGHRDGAGVAMGLASGALYALYAVMGRAGARRAIDPWTMVLYAFLANALAQLLFLLLGPRLFPAAPGLRDLLGLGPSAAGWAVLFGLAAGPTLLGFGLLNVALRHLPSSEASLVLTLEPALTAAIAYPLLGERMTRAEIAGSAVILGGVVLLHMKEGRAAPGRQRALLQRPILPSRSAACASTSSVLQKAKRTMRRLGSGAAWKLEPGTHASPRWTTSSRAKATSSKSESAE
jgi:drug/metabolite transporter (DMT)-like permease